jgi:hypothetical protein
MKSPNEISPLLRSISRLPLDRTIPRYAVAGITQRKNMYARSYSPPPSDRPQANPVTHTAKFQKYSTSVGENPPLRSHGLGARLAHVGLGQAELPGDLRWLDANLEGRANGAELSRRQMNDGRLDPRIAGVMRRECRPAPHPRANASMSCIALYPVVIQTGLPDGAGDSQYPALHLSHGALRRRQDGLQEGRQAAVVIGARAQLDGTGRGGKARHVG